MKNSYFVVICALVTAIFGIATMLLRIAML